MKPFEIKNLKIGTLQSDGTILSKRTYKAYMNRSRHPYLEPVTVIAVSRHNINRYKG